MKRVLMLLASAALVAACASDDGAAEGSTATGGADTTTADGADVGTGADTDGTADAAIGPSPDADTTDPAAPDADAGTDAEAPDTGGLDAAADADADVADPHEVGVDAGPPPDDDPGERSRRRMDVVQLDRSIRVVTGGIGWTDVVGGDGPSLFDALASTLGVPDFIDQTREDLSPSLLFHKFLSDAARSVCTAWIEQESDPSTAQGTFFAAGVSPTATLDDDLVGVFATVQRVLLRAHGHRYAPDAPQLQPWAQAFDEVVDATGETWRGWRAVCIAALMHPDFYSY